MFSGCDIDNTVLTGSDCLCGSIKIETDMFDDVEIDVKRQKYVQNTF